MARYKISDGQLIQGVKSGLSASEIARNHGMSHQAVSQRLRKLGLAARTEIVASTNAANELLKRDIDMVDEMLGLFVGTKRTLELLQDIADGKRPPEDAENILSGKCNLFHALDKTRQEARKQISLFLEVSKSLHNLQETRAIQQAILHEVKEADPETARKIVARLQQWGSLQTEIMRERGM